MAGSRRPSLSPCRCEDGFTIIEVMVAAVILIVGLTGVLGIVSQSDAVSASNRAREQGIGLEREIVEAARSISYEKLTQAQIVNTIRATNGLTDSTMTASGWTYTRRNVNYSVAVGTCAVDDPTDGTGPHETAGYCVSGTGSSTPAQCLTYLGNTGSIAGAGTAPSPAAAGDCGIDTNFDGAVDGLTDTSGGACTNCSGTDTNPNDYKRIVVLVRWNKGLGKRYALESTTVPNPGLAAAPAITVLSPPSVTAMAGDRLLNFSVTLNDTPAAVPWYVDSTGQGQATGSGTSWSFQWDLGAVSTGTVPNTNEILDGTYVVSAKGVDSFGQAGTTKASTVIVNRRQPYPPASPDAGRNNGNAYLDWIANSERDVEGYKVYRVQSGGDQLVCNLVKITRCKDTSIPAGAQQYYVTAVDRDSTGTLRDGDHSVTVPVPAFGADQPPTTPSTPRASVSGPNSAVVSWGASSDPDAGDSVQFYRIYRDGTDWVNDYYARTAGASNLSFTDTATNGDPHTYYVVAVDQSFTESAPGQAQ